MVGAYDRAGRLHYSGLTGAQRHDLLNQLRPIQRDAEPVHAEARAIETASWVEPVLTAHIAYRELTAGAQLRHPVWRGLAPPGNDTNTYLDEFR